MTAKLHEELFKRLRANDKTALKELFQQYYPSVCRQINRYVVDTNLAKDLAQNVFIRFWEKRATIKVNSNVGAYLARMGVNEALAHLRKKNIFNEEIEEKFIKDQAYSAEETYLQGELKEKITEAINELPPKCRAIFQMSRYEELSYKEIAAKLEISIKTVENQMGKALRVLRARLKGYIKE